MKKTLPLLIFLCMAHAGRAQFSTVEKIRVYYTKVNAKIAEAKTLNTGMYCNEVEVNKSGDEWPVVGKYKKHISLWYTAEPVASGIDNPEVLLEKVATSGETAGEKFSEEYLFYEGKLLFYYSANTLLQNGKMLRDEHRLYFNKGKLLKHNATEAGKAVPDTKKKLEQRVLLHAKLMQQLFLTSCEYSKEEAVASF